MRQLTWPEILTVAPWSRSPWTTSWGEEEGTTMVAGTPIFLATKAAAIPALPPKRRWQLVRVSIHFCYKINIKSKLNSFVSLLLCVLICNRVKLKLVSDRNCQKRKKKARHWLNSEVLTSIFHSGGLFHLSQPAKHTPPCSSQFTAFLCCFST